MPGERAWVHPQAVAEARAAREWYQARNAEAAEAFMAELDSALERIEEAPRQWPLTSATPVDTFSAAFLSLLSSGRRSVGSRSWPSRTHTAGRDTGSVGNSVDPLRSFTVDEIEDGLRRPEVLEKLRFNAIEARTLVSLLRRRGRLVTPTIVIHPLPGGGSVSGGEVKIRPPFCPGSELPGPLQLGAFQDLIPQ